MGVKKLYVKLCEIIAGINKCFVKTDVAIIKNDYELYPG